MSQLQSPPDHYIQELSVPEIEVAIKTTRDFFERNLAQALNLKRVSAPMFVEAGTGLNDDLNGVEKPVSFNVTGAGGVNVEVVQSLAKWKRHALGKYGYPTGEGLYTDMNAIRPDEVLDAIHSVYVDQWDWEKCISEGDRKVSTLIEAATAVYSVMRRTEFHVASRYHHIEPVLPRELKVVTTEELVALWPELSPREREQRFCKQHKAVFIVGIGGLLSDGQIHDGRAPDYDDWSTPRADGGSGLNGDIFVWHEPLGFALELSSMGIRVNAEALQRQLEIRDLGSRAQLNFHSRLLKGELPQTMGGGIGQSRLAMYFLRACHIGEVAVGIWPEGMREEYSKAGVHLL
jgi:aspartate--ammonia ligase